MSDRGKQRVIGLQKALKVARDALSRIEHGCRDPRGIAEEAGYEIMKIEHQINPTPVVGR